MVLAHGATRGGWLTSVTRAGTNECWSCSLKSLAAEEVFAIKKSSETLRLTITSEPEG